MAFEAFITDDFLTITYNKRAILTNIRIKLNLEPNFSLSINFSYPNIIYSFSLISKRKLKKASLLEKPFRFCLL